MRTHFPSAVFPKKRFRKSLWRRARRTPGTIEKHRASEGLPRPHIGQNASISNISSLLREAVSTPCFAKNHVLPLWERHLPPIFRARGHRRMGPPKPPPDCPLHEAHFSDFFPGASSCETGGANGGGAAGARRASRALRWRATKRAWQRDTVRQCVNGMCEGKKRGVNVVQRRWAVRPNPAWVKSGLPGVPMAMRGSPASPSTHYNKRRGLAKGVSGPNPKVDPECADAQREQTL